MPIATTEEEDKAGLDQLVHGEKSLFLWRTKQIK